MDPSAEQEVLPEVICAADDCDAEATVLSPLDDDYFCAKHDPNAETEARIVCLGCGRTVVGDQGDPTDVAPAQHCGECPPWVCDDCHETCSTGNLCRCWTQLDGLPLADVKGLLAKADLSVNPPEPERDGGES